MFFILLIFSLFLGLSIGSFLNVIIYRYGTGLSPFQGRSQCAVCNKKLKWYELIPLLSFIVQKGECRGCGTKISIQYPIVELLTSVLFVCVFVRQYNLYPLYSMFSFGVLYSVLFFVFYAIIVSLLVVISVYDYHHKIIPDTLVYWFDGLAIAKLFFFSFVCLGASPFAFPYVYDLVAPVVFFIPFWFLWRISAGRWIGFGDAKLAVGIGALLGFVYGLSAIVLGFWIGSIICIVLMMMEKKFPQRFGGLNSQSEIPLGPFLIAGTIFVLFTHIDVMGVSSYFSVL